MSSLPVLDPVAPEHAPPATGKGAPQAVPAPDPQRGEGFAAHMAEARRPTQRPAPRIVAGEPQLPAAAAPAAPRVGTEPVALTPEANPSPYEQLTEGFSHWRSAAELDLERFEVLGDAEVALDLSPAPALIPSVAPSPTTPSSATAMEPAQGAPAGTLQAEPLPEPAQEPPDASTVRRGPDDNGSAASPPRGEGQAAAAARQGSGPQATPQETHRAATPDGPPAQQPTQAARNAASSAPPLGSSASAGVGAGSSGAPPQHQSTGSVSTAGSVTATPTSPQPAEAEVELTEGTPPRTRTSPAGPGESALPSPRMASTPESMYFTWEFDTAASRSIAQPAAPTVAPSLLSQLAAASQREPGALPLPPSALPDQINLLIRDPEGDIRLTVGREERDVAVKVEVPHGLMAAVKEAEAPMRASLQDGGYQLEGFEVREREAGVDQQPEHQQPHRRAQRPRQGQARAGQDPESTRSTSTPGLRLLDRRA